MSLTCCPCCNRRAHSYSPAKNPDVLFRYLRQRDLPRCYRALVKLDDPTSLSRPGSSIVLSKYET